MGYESKNKLSYSRDFALAYKYLEVILKYIESKKLNDKVEILFF